MSKITKINEQESEFIVRHILEELSTSLSQICGELLTKIVFDFVNSDDADLDEKSKDILMEKLVVELAPLNVSDFLMRKYPLGSFLHKIGEKIFAMYEGADKPKSIN